MQWYCQIPINQQVLSRERFKCKFRELACRRMIQTRRDPINIQKPRRELQNWSSRPNVTIHFPRAPNCDKPLATRGSILKTPTPLPHACFQKPRATTFASQHRVRDSLAKSSLNKSDLHLVVNWEPPSTKSARSTKEMAIAFESWSWALNN